MGIHKFADLFQFKNCYMEKCKKELQEEFIETFPVFQANSVEEIPDKMCQAICQHNQMSDDLILYVNCIDDRSKPCYQVPMALKLAQTMCLTKDLKARHHVEYERLSVYLRNDTSKGRWRMNELNATLQWGSIELDLRQGITSTSK